MRARIFSLGLFVLTAASAAFADTADDVAAYDAILSTVEPDQTTVALGDMIVRVETVRAWRNKLAGVASTKSASQTGVNKWTGGVVYHTFDASVSAAHQRATLDAMAEWTAFANVTFTARVAQPNYILVKEVAGLGGGVAALGMVGPAQQFDIGPSAWNRGTLLHELGHTLGLIHEHQRNDRDTYVTIGAAVASNGNFVLVPTSTNNGPYDFLSVMHYARDTFAPLGVDDITPKPGYTQFIDIMGNNPDRLLSRGDRNGIALMYPSAPVLTTVVTNTKDSGVGSLRAAIHRAFDIVTDTPGATPTITFQIPNTDPNFAGGVFTIQPTDRMTAPGTGTTIDATTQTAFTGDTNASGPEVVLNGALQSAPEYYTPGLRLSAANVTVKGLVISGFSTYGVLLAGSATGSTVAGCYIGTNAAGTAAAPNAYAGVQFETGATGNRIGGTTAAARNVISGQTNSGIAMTGDTTTGNIIEGNYIGTNAAGTAALANGYSGIAIDGSWNNTIGGTSAGARNVISGNTYRGIDVGSGRGNVIAGNYIGVNAAGTAALPNQAGIYMLGTLNTIGGTAAGAGNVISGNTYQGIYIGDLGSDGNVVAGNFIGLNAAGTAAVPNGNAGIDITGGVQNNVIGGTSAGARNVISGNTSQGIVIRSEGMPTKNNVVAGNYIGTNPAGTAAIPNGFAGVEISSGSRTNTIGGTAPGARNVISGNANQGVSINGTGTLSNVVAGNYIGTNAAGTAAVANGFPGIEIFGGASANTVGGNVPGAGNVISGNAFRGVSVIGAGTNSNIFTGNLVGLNAAGTAALANAGPGILIFGGAQNNEVGATSGGRNFICGNSAQGLLFIGGGTTGNLVRGNSIGIAPGGGAIANGDQGIALWADGSGSPQGNTIGGSTPGAANLISGNTTAGIALYDTNTTGNRISGNAIFANGGLGIDLLGNGVTANDVNDADAGPNNLQNFPVLTSAVLGTGTTVAGTFTSTPAVLAYRIEFFENTTGEASGNGEGQNFIGALNVNTDASGAASFNTTLPAIVPAGHVITATATDPAGNTSEFSQTRIVTTTDSDSDGLPDAYELANWPLLTTTTGAADSDGDGMTNAQEFRAGTNPRDPASVFRLAPPITAGADKTINLANFAGRTYRIDYADILATPTPWRVLADQIPGTGSTISITDPGAAALPQRYYRAVVEP